MSGLAICLAPAGRAEPRLDLLSEFTWELSDPWFGGFSALEVTGDGATFIAISDRATVVEGRFRREEDVIVEVDLLSIDPLRDAGGTPLRDGRGDAEGLAVSASGQAYLSFENRHRVTRLDPAAGTTEDLPGHADFAGFSHNTGLEALAVHPDGSLFALSEAKAGDDGRTPLYRQAPEGWKIAQHIPLPGPFVPVGADFDEEGRLYLLERALSPLGFRSRIRRVDLSQTPVTVEVLLSTIPGAFDNLEALSVWRDPEGQTRLVMISDDNFLPVQRTQIVEYRVSE